MASKLIFPLLILEIGFLTSDAHGIINEQLCALCKRNSSLHTTQDAQVSTSTGAEQLLILLPPLRPAPEASEGCRAQLDEFYDDLQQLKLWALLMHDSSAKLPSGLLNGNVNQFGDFDQCLSVERKAEGGSDSIRGKYCLMSLQLRLQSSALASVTHIHRLMHSNYLFASDLDDPGHRVPRFSSIQWGVCVPSACRAHDVRGATFHQLAPALAAVGLHLEVRLDEKMCQVLEDEYWPLGTVITGAFLVGLICIVVIATIFDNRCSDKTNNALRCLSLKQNMSKLVSDSSSADDIGCVHGIRFVNSVMLILSHKSMAAMYLPFANRTRMSVEVSEPWAVMSRAASLYTDPFLMLSGLLSTTALLRRFDRQASVSLVDEYISRLIRLMPSLAALILFCTWLMPRVGHGPLWPQVVTHHADICKRTWWRNLLFVHNYFGFKDMCLTHTHHVGIDAQLYAATPLAVWALVRWPRPTVLVLLALAALSTLARFVVTYQYHLSNFVAYGTSIKQLFATADHMYILPAYRATVYIMGMLMGYLLYNSKNMILSKAQVRTGWTFAVCALCASFSGTVEMGTMDYVYNVSLSSHYAAVAPITWCAFFAWTIYISQMGYQNWLTKLLSWKKYALWTKISYSVYLTQFPIFFYYVGTTRFPIHYNLFEQLFNWKEFFYILIYSLILTLMIEMPCQNLRNLINKKRINWKRKAEEMVVSSTDEKSKPVNKTVDIVERYRPAVEDRLK